MSPLTKLFVVLLVVLSLLQTAAIVVYVNKEDFNRNALQATAEKLQARDNELEQSRQSLMAAQQNLTALQQDANSRTREADAQVNAARQQVANFNVQLANAESQKAAQQLEIDRLTEAVKASQQASNKQYNEIARLRTRNDKYVQNAADLNAAVSDLTNKYEVTERERKFLAEQNTQLQAQNQKLGAQLKAAGVSPQEAALAAERSGPPIAGIVRDVRTIAGMPYATISVGSANQVARGMEFKIINQKTNDYLGSLIVDSVSPNEASGKLTGPHVDQIRAGVEARTQL